MRWTSRVLAACGSALLLACGGPRTSSDEPAPTGRTTGASFAVDIDEDAHYDSMADMIRGQIPGLEVIESPGGEVQLRIRGMIPPPTLTSMDPSDTTATGARRSARGLTNTDPLLVIDDMPVTPGNNSRALTSLNPNEVASIVVHKDAASTVSWGARGANGVIVIRTKRR